MNENIEFLNYIHQNSQMGKETIGQLVGIVKDEQYRTMLQSQLNEYQLIYDFTQQRLQTLNAEVKDISGFSKASGKVMINLNTLTNKTPSHISEMLIQGSTMGIIDITKKIKEYPNADKEIVDVANKLLATEQNNVDQCKKYLQ